MLSCVIGRTWILDRRSAPQAPVDAARLRSCLQLGGNPLRLHDRKYFPFAW